MGRLIKSSEKRGYQNIIAEDNNYLNYLSFGKLFLESEQVFDGMTGEYETVLVILSGIINVSCKENNWERLGNRKSVFDGKATAVYIPCKSKYRVVAVSKSQIAVCKAKAEEKHEPFIITPKDVIIHYRGKESWKREVHDIITDNGDGRVQHIIVGETFNEPGHWSSYPPHKHDRAKLPEEAELEEIYHYQIEPIHGFGVQLLYTHDRSIDEAHIVRHGDSFIIDQGYHPVSAAGGYKIYYLWFLAGRTGRTLGSYDDPNHKWLTRN